MAIFLLVIETSLLSPNHPQSENQRCMYFANHVEKSFRICPKVQDIQALRTAFINSAPISAAGIILILS